MIGEGERRRQISCNRSACSLRAAAGHYGGVQPSWVGLLGVALALGACTDDSASQQSDGDGVPVTAGQLAHQLGCGSTTPRQVDVAEPARPREALDCRIGDQQFGIQVYRSNEQRDQVLEYLDQYAGFRAIGPLWIVAVDTPEAGRSAAKALEGEFVTLRGTTGG